MTALEHATRNISDLDNLIERLNQVRDGDPVDPRDLHYVLNILHQLKDYTVRVVATLPITGWEFLEPENI